MQANWFSLAELVFIDISPIGFQKTRFPAVPPSFSGFISEEKYNQHWKEVRERQAERERQETDKRWKEFLERERQAERERQEKQKRWEEVLERERKEFLERERERQEKYNQALKEFRERERPPATFDGVYTNE